MSSCLNRPGTANTVLQYPQMEGVGFIMTFIFITNDHNKPLLNFKQLKCSRGSAEQRVKACGDTVAASGMLGTLWR